MKILEINKFHYIKGGADKHFLDVTRLLREKGHEVAVFSMENDKNNFSAWKKYFVSYVGYGPEDTLWQKIKGAGRMFYSFEARRNVKKLLDDFQPDIAHIHNIYHQISPSILPEIKKRGIPIIMTVHDYKLICPNYLLLSHGKEWNNAAPDRYWQFIKDKGFKNSFWKSLLVVLETIFHQWLDIYDRHIDCYIVPSEFTRKKLIRNGMKEEKIVVLPHFFSMEDWNEKGAVKLPEKYVLHFGRLSREKGVNALIKIFKSMPEVSLYLAGTIEDGLEIPSHSNVRYAGFLRPRELARYIKNSLFVVSASRLPETFGLVALEAMQNGKPFVGYDAGAYGEVVGDNATGYICRDEKELKEKISLLVRDEGLRILFSRNALERAKNFDREVYYRKFMEIIKVLHG